MVRFCWEAADDAFAKYGISARELFEIGPGPLSLYFESGAVIGAASQPSLSSVIVWLERDVHGPKRDDPMAVDPELHPISADDARYADSRWAASHGARVTAICVLAPHEQAGDSREASYRSGKVVCRARAAAPVPPADGGKTGDGMLD